MSIPSAANVGRIAALPDAVVRNLQITQCYHELSLALAGIAGREANWCTFATWASKQAGQTIRGEDPARAAETLLREAPELEPLLAVLQREVGRLGVRWDARALREELLRVLDPRPALRAASDAVARGNLKVFEEIGLAFAHFLALCEDGHGADAEAVRRFCDALRPGEPPEGQRLLREAFVAYGEACTATDPQARAELMFFANLLIGLHEQTRLQPEIAAAMNVSFGDEEALRGRLLWVLLPGRWLRARLWVARLLKRRLPLDVALDRLIERVRAHVRRALTETLMTLAVAEGRALRLGRVLDVPFAPLLAQPMHPALIDLLAIVDPTPGSPAGSGAADWAHLP